MAAVSLCIGTSAYAILAGGEFDLPVDRPSYRIDPLTSTSPFNSVGALEIFSGSSRYYGSAVALSPNWVLTAGHNVDFNDDGQPDAGLSVNFHLPGFGSYSVGSFYTHPSFTGFSNPTIYHDLSLLYFIDPLPNLFFPALGLSLNVNDTITLAGFGRSGYGSYGYTTTASLTDRRIGYNVIDSFQSQAGGDGLLFRYDFDAPATTGQPGGSLGNDLETLIGPGDSGGPALIDWDGSYALAGINTFTEGYGGKFGDTGGGIVLDPYWDWISGVTGLAMIPEPGTALLFFAGLAALFSIRRKKGITPSPFP
jgi:hypothetical protein